jgi:hypothetical protein
MFPVHTSRFAYYFIMYDVTHTSHLGLKVGNDTSVSSFDVELLICGFLLNDLILTAVGTSRRMVWEDGRELCLEMSQKTLKTDVRQLEW